ncbi:DUF3429 domain-containing protein [Blastomonas fulva]|uniref:DUF3429 domain-containing protein n=1 Tax=Blastomonas fulva TaxID=1550728 RepID=UPI003F726335
MERAEGTNRTLMQALTFAGALPFLAGASCHITGYGDVNAANLTCYWAFTILMFMAGTLWGIQVVAPQKVSPNLLIASNVVVLGTCAALWFVPFNEAALLFAIGFGVLLWLDRRAMEAGATDTAYGTMRARVSAIVIACLVLIAVVPMGTIG